MHYELPPEIPEKAAELCGLICSHMIQNGVPEEVAIPTAPYILLTVIQNIISAIEEADDAQTQRPN
jgi:hypothetical protein